MSATADDVFSDNSYAAPKADLRGRQDAVATPDKLFSREGRMGVMAYNTRFFLCLLGVFAAFSPLLFVVISGGLESLESAGPAVIVAGLVGVVGAAFFSVIMICAAVKRLHDLGKSGWFYLLGVVPIVGSFYVLYYSLMPANADDNKFGVQRQPTKSDRICGYIGVVLVVLMFVGGLVDSVSSLASLGAA